MLSSHQPCEKVSILQIRKLSFGDDSQLRWIMKPMSSKTWI